MIVYPTAHRGGELVLRHKGREWNFDTNALTSSLSSPSLSYVAFYSDIEHEVLKVTEGSRVTLTYNLYLTPNSPTSRVPGPSDPSTASVKPIPKDTTNFQAALRQSLKNPEFLPEGGTLAFNLAHLYPVTFDTKLKEMTAYLKGEDAHIYQSCLGLKLEPTLQMIYADRSVWSTWRQGPEHGVMMEAVVKTDWYDYQTWSYEDNLIEELGGIPVNLSNHSFASNLRYWDERDEDTDEPGGVCEQLTWLTDFSKSANALEDAVVSYGNDATVKHIYCSPCLIVRIGPASDRA